MKWGLPYGSAGIESSCNAGDLGLIPGLGRSPGEGKAYPRQYSSLGNSMDCIIHGVAKNQTQLSYFHLNEMIFVFYYVFQHVGDSFMCDVWLHFIPFQSSIVFQYNIILQFIVSSPVNGLEVVSSFFVVVSSVSVNILVCIPLYTLQEFAKYRSGIAGSKSIIFFTLADVLYSISIL